MEIPLISLGITLAINVAAIAYFAGGVKKDTEYIKTDIKEFKDEVRDDIQRLENKQDKHNCLVERMVAVEHSSKSAHHRLDSMEGKKK